MKPLFFSFTCLLLVTACGEAEHKGMTPLEGEPLITVSGYALEKNGANCAVFFIAEGDGITDVNIGNVGYPMMEASGGHFTITLSTEENRRTPTELQNIFKQSNIPAFSTASAKATCQRTLQGYFVTWGYSDMYPERDSDCEVTSKSVGQLTGMECAQRVRFEIIKNFDDMESDYPGVYRYIEKTVLSQADPGTVNLEPI